MSVGLKGQQIGSEQSLKQFLSPGQNRKNFTGGERDVQKKADGRVRQFITKHLREQYQVIVMHPYQITRLVMIQDRFAENLVCFDVCVPVPCIELQLGREVVEYRPEGLICVALIKSQTNFGRKINCNTVFRIFPAPKARLTLLFILLRVSASPADPV